MADGATRWLTYDDMAAALAITPDSARRLATRHRWPRRPGNDGRALVAVPEERLGRAEAPRADVVPDGRGDTAPPIGRDARALIAYLERRVGELTDDVAVARRVAKEARAEAQAARQANEELRTQVGQIDALTALVAAERAHLSTVRAERDRLVAILDDRRPPWFERFTGGLLKAS